MKVTQCSFAHKYTNKGKVKGGEHNTMAGSDEICCLHLIGQCDEGADAICDKVHSSMPYQWQSQSQNQWIPLSDNEEIEHDYCNPAKTKHVGNLLVDFDTMTCGLEKVRRISTSTSALSPELSPELSSLLIKWVWYWEEAADTWKEFGPLAGELQSSPITSDELERRYLSGETTVIFTAGSNQYELSFLDMLQTNISTQTQRFVRRRPVLISKPDVQRTSEIYCSKVQTTIPLSLPDYWDPRQLPIVGYERIELNSVSSEYIEVLNSFNRTMEGCNNLSIERIQNLTLWKSFDLQKDDMKIKSVRDVDERLLFHGTKARYVDAICKENIDKRIDGENGTWYGEGSYFARDAKYSNQFTDKQGRRSMFMCRILVGDFTAGRPDYIVPPYKVEQLVAFDSCVDKVDDPNIFVIFEKNQIYPEYLIQYEEPVVQIQHVVPKSGTCGCDRIGCGNCLQYFLCCSCNN
ncbi:protein mono-ADP-ribosyltransferase PARP12-like [Sardina pilchardus]|uniref:protein mono-ADP-ribosyltransferase PARP12-like n=1 Tax=Sardina pilchardus TaxID=27697 RepID=UPI002E1575B8